MLCDVLSNGRYTKKKQYKEKPDLNFVYFLLQLHIEKLAHIHQFICSSIHTLTPFKSSQESLTITPLLDLSLSLTHTHTPVSYTHLLLRTE